MADQGLMPKGLLNEYIRSLKNNSVLYNAIIMDPNFDLDASLHRSTNDNDKGFDDSLILILEKDDNDLPRLIDYLDDPMEVGWNDYHGILDVSTMSQADKFEKR